jgi:dihydrofolate reductase
VKENWMRREERLAGPRAASAVIMRAFSGGVSNLNRLTLVAAMARNRVVGHEGGMPWHLPADLKHFKAVTLGHPVVMGRRTFESIGRALPGRTNIVISRGQPVLPEGVVLAHSLDEAVEHLAGQRVMVIGGGAIYRAAIDRADRMELTFIDATVSGDTTFPEWQSGAWQLQRMKARPADAKNPHALVFASYRRAPSRT